MIIADNKLQIAKLRLAYIVTFAVGLIFILYASFSKNPVTENIIALIIGVLLFIIFFYLLIIKPEYLYMSIEKNSKIVFRNYTAFPLFRKYKAFEITINEIQDFELKKKMFGIQKFIRISVLSKGKVWKYPWLSLSALPSKDFKKTINTLNKLLPVEKRKENSFI